jgi:alkyl hydroperoxide reductase subunit AhpF
MIQIIAGAKGRGKTKILIDNVNSAVEKAKGSIVYLDKSNKHMYELSNKIRLINVKAYLVENSKEFLGFICGIISQDHDLEAIYLDSFLKVSHLDCKDFDQFSLIFDKLKNISEKYKVDFVISLSCNKSDLPDTIQELVTVSL